MSVDLVKLNGILDELRPYQATLVAVSKTKPESDILEVLNHGHSVFGENYVQELVSKQINLPKTIQWHFIGHLQSNKVKLIVPFVNLIHGVDSWNLMTEINKQAQKYEFKLDLLLQVHIAVEETKFGLDSKEIFEIVEKINKGLVPAINLRGLMGMASLTDNQTLIRKEFNGLNKLFASIQSELPADKQSAFNVLSMGMSSDYKIALDEGSTMIRIGSAIFGGRS